MVPFLALAWILRRQMGYRKSIPPPQTAAATAPPMIAALLADTVDETDASSRPTGLSPRMLLVTAAVVIVPELLESPVDVSLGEITPVSVGVMKLNSCGQVSGIVDRKLCEYFVNEL